MRCLPKVVIILGDQSSKMAANGDKVKYRTILVKQTHIKKEGVVSLLVNR